MCQCGGLTEILDNMQGQDSWKGHLKAKGGTAEAACAFDLGRAEFAVGEEGVCAATPSQTEPAAAFISKVMFF